MWSGTADILGAIGSGAITAGVMLLAGLGAALLTGGVLLIAWAVLVSRSES